MYKIEVNDDIIAIEHNNVKKIYAKHGIDNFLLGCLLDRENKLQIATKQYNRLFGEYNTLLRICHNNSIVDTGFWDKNKEYKVDWQYIESEEL